MNMKRLGLAALAGLCIAAAASIAVAGVVEGIGCCIDETCVVLGPEECIGQGGVPGEPGSDCSTTTCAADGIACCIDETCVELGPEECIGQGGVPGEPGSDCSTTTCVEDVACCIDEVCVPMPEEDCTSQGGVSGGAGSVCETSSCVEDVACCIDDVCVPMPEEDCIAQGGSSGGAGSDCSTTSCVDDVACCIDDTCVALSEEECLAQGGESGGEGSDCSTTVCVEPPLECRMTGGGHDESGYWSGGMDSGTCSMGGGTNRYTYGGQAGAPTASQPQPYGEWTHHQKSGPDGMFVFHGGTASAPPGTEIDFVECSDPGWCMPARQAPAKQLDFDGVGTFKNMKNTSTLVSNAAIVGTTLHYFHVHIEDLGEPGKGKKGQVGNCPPDGNFGSVAPCDCPDFYEITIHEGITSASPVIYHVHGYVDGGNLQIHPPIGYMMAPAP